MPLRATGGKTLLTIIIMPKWIQKEEKLNSGKGDGRLRMNLVQNLIKFTVFYM